MGVSAQLEHTPGPKCTPPISHHSDALILDTTALWMLMVDLAGKDRMRYREGALTRMGETLQFSEENSAVCPTPLRISITSS